MLLGGEEEKASLTDRRTDTTISNVACPRLKILEFLALIFIGTWFEDLFLTGSHNSAVDLTVWSIWTRWTAFTWEKNEVSEQFFKQICIASASLPLLTCISHLAQLFFSPYNKACQSHFKGRSRIYAGKPGMKLCD